MRCGHKKTALSDGLLEKKNEAQAFFDLVLALAPSFFRFKYALRRFRFSTLLYCLPINKCLYITGLLRLFNQL